MAKRIISLGTTGKVAGDLSFSYCKKISDGTAVSPAAFTLTALGEGDYIIGLAVTEDVAFRVYATASPEFWDADVFSPVDGDEAKETTSVAIKVQSDKIQFDSSENVLVSSQTPVEIDAQQFQQLSDDAFESAGQWAVTVTIVDQVTGLPLVGVPVSVYSVVDLLIGSLKTDSNGRVVHHLDNGTYTVRMKRPFYDFSDEGLIVSGGNLVVQYFGIKVARSLPLPAFGSVNLVGNLIHIGTIVEAGVSVEIEPADKNTYVPGRVVSSTVVRTTTDANGDFAFEIPKGVKFKLSIGDYFSATVEVDETYSSDEVELTDLI